MNLQPNLMSSNSPDSIPAELREAERDIDAVYRENPLVQQPFARACWYCLSVLEEQFAGAILRERRFGLVEQRAFADYIVVHSKIPVAWLKASCRVGGQAPVTIDWSTLAAARQFHSLAQAYFSFETAFSWATLGFADLRLDGAVIRAAGAIYDDCVYDAYDRLVDVRASSPRPDLESIPRSLQRWTQQVVVRGDRFDYRLTNRDYEAFRESMPELADRFALPPEWDFGRFTLGEFRDVATALWVSCFCHQLARLAAIRNGAPHNALLGAVLLTSSRALERRMARLSGVGEDAVRAVLDLLRYGSNKQRTPDPALQPVIELGSHVGLAPSIVTNSSLERNLAVLANRVPELRRIYASLSGARERLLREEILSELIGTGLRSWSGTLAEWAPTGEVDLTLIDDTARCALILELKAFVGPAEPREIKDRSEEIGEGVRQALKRRRMAIERRSALDRVLDIDPDYQVYVAVASKTSIGIASAQDPTVAVVNAGHLVRMIKRVGLAGVIVWLDSRAYLPTEGLHYLRKKIQPSVGRWTLEWFGIEILSVEGFV